MVEMFSGSEDGKCVIEYKTLTATELHEAIDETDNQVPELGHMLFGNMTGCHVPLNRSAVEEAFRPLFDVGFDEYGYYRNNLFSNEIFEINPYWWGDPDDERAAKPNFLYKPTGFEIRWCQLPSTQRVLGLKVGFVPQV